MSNLESFLINYQKDPSINYQSLNKLSEALTNLSNCEDLKGTDVLCYINSAKMSVERIINNKK